jgi:hypothetical protein
MNSKHARGGGGSCQSTKYVQGRRFIFTVSYPPPPLAGKQGTNCGWRRSNKKCQHKSGGGRSELRLLQFIHTTSPGAHGLYRGTQPLQGLMASTGGFFWPLCIWDSFFAGALKGLCHEMNNFFLKSYYDKYVLSVHALIVFSFFCFLREGKKSNSKF